MNGELQRDYLNDIIARKKTETYKLTQLIRIIIIIEITTGIFLDVNHRKIVKGDDHPFN